MFYKTSVLRQENLNSDGKRSPYIEEGQTTQFHQYQQDEQSPFIWNELTENTKTTTWIMSMSMSAILQFNGPLIFILSVINKAERWLFFPCN
jgi:hypothetical protein